MSKKAEMETVTVQVPKAIMDFLRHVEADPRKYLEHRIVAIVQSDLNSDEIWSPREISKQFNLETALKSIEN